VLRCAAQHGTALLARDSNLGDGTLLGIYPLPEIPMVRWTGFGQQ
jgi:hypothetical protein